MRTLRFVTRNSIYVMSEEVDGAIWLSTYNVVGGTVKDRRVLMPDYAFEMAWADIESGSRLRLLDNDGRLFLFTTPVCDYLKIVR